MPDTAILQAHTFSFLTVGVFVPALRVSENGKRRLPGSPTKVLLFCRGCGGGLIRADVALKIGCGPGGGGVSPYRVLSLTSTHLCAPFLQPRCLPLLVKRLHT